MNRIVLLLGLLLVGANLVVGSQGTVLLQTLGIKPLAKGPAGGGGGSGGEFTPIFQALPPASPAPTPAGRITTGGGI